MQAAIRSKLTCKVFQFRLRGITIAIITSFID